MSKVAEKAAERAEAIERLKEIFPRGSEVYTIILYVAQSGMSRSIAVLGVDGKRITNLSWLVSRAVDRRRSRNHDGVHMTGAGMDMGFALVYDLALQLYGDGYALQHRWVS